MNKKMGEKMGKKTYTYGVARKAIKAADAVKAPVDPVVRKCFENKTVADSCIFGTDDSKEIEFFEKYGK